ncbi:helix-turn-helix transcriptional regulator [Tunicatimonas pelagia]|uniref:helix-turn-helix transcriptional regulator n=1 Tax=Tunicatimonas pelagia TaxID=931531 RepID=UPI002665A860|nr:AraC family transcriptional regulator [Tunicatimonas pelagia]WKN43289.1 AraC family transcriptional regulator [Tunicatimonas pelagia]
MEITVTSKDRLGLMQTIASALEVPLVTNNHVQSFQLPKRLGLGTVETFQLHDGLSLVSIQGTLKEDLLIHLEQLKYHPLRLIFCRKGKLIHSVNARLIQYQLNASENSLSACSGSVDQLFRFHAHLEQAIYIIEINRSYYLSRIDAGLESIHPHLEKTFRDVDAQYPFLYQGYYSIGASECLNQIWRTQYQGLILRTFLESKVLELLSLVLSQYSDDQKPSSEQVMLREHDEEALLNAKKIIMDRLANPPSIKELAHMIGINELKLKQGYKQLFHATIYHHIRQERLRLSKVLLAEGKWNVGEVAQRIGYTNKSHFATKFKEKFGMFPKQFQQYLLKNH